MSDIDKELAAMKRIANALQSLDKPARLRVMTWMISAHEQETAFESEEELEKQEETEDAFALDVKPEESKEPDPTKKAPKR